VKWPDVPPLNTPSELASAYISAPTADLHGPWKGAAEPECRAGSRKEKPAA
jgi:hypothetical protein